MTPATLSRMGRPKKDEPTEQVRIPQSLAKRLRRIAAHEDVDAGDIVAELIADRLDARERKMLDDVAKERGEAKKKGGSQ